MLGTEHRAAGTFNEYLITHPIRKAKKNTRIDPLGREASAHMDFIFNRTACGSPKLALVRPVPHQVSEKYYPPRTLLYRCSDEFGCCTDEDETCQPIIEETVHLPFWVSDDLVLKIKFNITQFFESQN